MSFNPTTTNLKPYPIEEFNRIKKSLLEKQIQIMDFGAGDPRIPVWEPIVEALRDAVSQISQYPSVRGIDQLREAQFGYLERRFGVEKDEQWDILPTSGSKEAIFHMALSLVGRADGRRLILYPDPGYPVYRSSIEFAGGTPYPVQLKQDNDYLLEPWELPKHVQRDAAAVWINYPHNPTGAFAPADYLEKLVSWAEETNTLLLSDECYVDLYNPNLSDDDRPLSLLSFGKKNVLVFMSLSKRSGMTGYRSGFMAGDADLIQSSARARANFGVATPTFIQTAAVVAWSDDDHVEQRRKIFFERMQAMGDFFKEIGMLESIPNATFYLWCRLPDNFKGDDVKFCMKLAEKGLIASPSQWLSEGMKGFVRFSLVPELDEVEPACEILRDFCKIDKASDPDEPESIEASEAEENNVDEAEEGDASEAASIETLESEVHAE